jgi:Raf kinase inhibitor-like YbhB/YbcL family protein
MFQLNLDIKKFTKNNKIVRKYICKNHDGNNMSPSLSWAKISEVKSYALILEDPDAVIGNFVHWYLPFIDPSITTISSLNYNDSKNKKKEKDSNKKIRIIHGKNTLKEIGYHGPCAPPNSGIHRYIFTLYALNGKLDFIRNSKNLQIEDSANFETILKKNKIEILAFDKKEFHYSYKDFY